jgi:hypothetical protein
LADADAVRSAGFRNAAQNGAKPVLRSGINGLPS